jgi:nitrile hydratase
MYLLAGRHTPVLGVPIANHDDSQHAADENLTLCSCYPWPLLGLPPRWYKSASYRSRAVIDPRGVVREFGLAVSEDTEVRVWDSTSEVRYIVLPQRPAGSEKLGEEELAALVTRDVMVGVANVSLQPERRAT